MTSASKAGRRWAGVITLVIGTLVGVGCPVSSAWAAMEAGAEIAPEARAVLEAELAKVRAATSVRGSVKSIWDMKMQNFPGHANEFLVEYAVAKPDKVWAKSKDVTIWGDGQTLTVHVASLKQYRQVPFPPVDRLRETVAELSGGQMKSFPGEAVLRPDPKDYPLEETIKSVRTLTGVKKGEYEGKAGVWVVGTGFDENNAPPPGTPDYPLERFVADADGMTYALKQDWTAMYTAIAAKKYEEDSKDDPSIEPARVFEKATWLTTYTREMNTEIPASVFAFTPSEGDVKVDEFVFKRPGLETQVKLLGQMVPDIKGTDLDGKAVGLRDFKGKVLVLDFWATWCGPCVQGLPSMQAIYDKYKDDGLVILGMNRDAKGKTEKVKAFLARKQITLPQFDDSGSAGADVFEAMAIPCVVFIDREGIVQEIEIGYVKGKEKKTEATIVKLLSNEPVRTAEELERYKRQVLGK